MNNKTIKFVNGDRQLWEKFKIKQVIGTGNSIVYEVIDDQGTIECAKQIRLDDKQAEFIFRKQIELLSKIRSKPHPNIVQYRGSYCIQQMRGNFPGTKKGYIQMEKGMANLKTYLAHRQQPFQQQQLMQFILNMVQVFAHLQRSEVAHRDIKPSNILLFCQDPLFFKVCDVGAGTAVGFCDHTKQMTVIGTPYYLSPELYRAYTDKLHLINYKAYKSDCYSLGLVILQVGTLKRAERLKNECQSVQKLIIQIKQRYPNIIGLGKTLRRMLDKQISNRLDFIELQKFINQNHFIRNRYNKTICLDPTLALTLSQSNLLSIDKIQNLSQMQTLVSTNNKLSRLNISLESFKKSNKKQDRDILQDLINIKYMNLQELSISIEMGQVNDKHLALLAEAIQKNRNLSSFKLNLWNNQISQNGLKNLMNILVKLPLLDTFLLNIASNQLRLDKQLQKSFHIQQLPLKILQLNFSFNQLLPELLKGLCQIFEKCQKLKSLTLNMESCKLSGVHIGKAFKSITNISYLQQINIIFSCNSVRDEGIFALGDLFEKGVNIKKASIYLRNSQITDKGFSEFIKGISQCKNLKQLKVNLGLKTGAPFLQSLTSLQKLDINLSNNKLSDFAFKYLCNGVLTVRGISKLRLAFDACSLTQKGCLYLGRLVSQEPKLQSFDLSIRNNDIKFDGVQYICAGLIQVKKVKKLKLNLQGTLIGDYPANYLAACLLKLRTLTSVDLNLQNCDLTSETMSNIVKAVRQCCQKNEQVSINMRKNREIKQQLLAELRRSMENKRIAIKVDQVSSFMIT